MLNMILGVVLGLFFFIATIKAYTLGFKHAKEISKGITPKMETNPVKTFKEFIEHKEEKKKEDLVLEGLQNIYNYDPYSIKKEGE